MAQSNPNLIPTVITDVNGRVTTVHRKQGAAVSNRKMPAPVLKKTPSHASRLRDLKSVVDDSSRTMIKSKAEKFLKSSTPEQLAVLDEAVSRFHDAPQHERDVISYALGSLALKNRDTGIMVEILTLRNAFCSEWMSNNQYRTFDFEALILGVREQHDTPIDTSTPDSNKRAEAVLRFAYELKSLAPQGGFLPIAISTRPEANYKFVYGYDRPELVTLLSEHPDRVDELIQYALDQQTCDPTELWRFINHDGPKPLTSGFL